MNFIYNLSNVLQKISLRLFANWQVVGRENVPEVGPLIIVANHQSNFDPALLAPSIPRRIRFLAKDSIFQGPAIARWFLKEYGAFPLNRSGVDVRAHRWAIDQLRHDGVIAIFPEGTRSQSGMKKAHIGVTRLALTTQATIQPVGITGTERFGTWMRVFNPTGRLTVTIGQPFVLPVIEGRPDKAVLESLTDMIMNKIADLLPPEYQGIYRDKGSDETDGYFAKDQSTA